MPHDEDRRRSEERFGRRELIGRAVRAGAAVTAGSGLLAALDGCGGGANRARTTHGRPVTRAHSGAPNILVVLVDQMRTPVWPGTVPLRHATPNIDALRQSGVSFTHHYTAANDCSPSRSTLLTGLYTHQTGCLITGGSTLDPGFPTWGSMLREQGYATYWYGKWHLTRGDNEWRPRAGNGPLERYGFAGGTYPSPDGGPGQGMHADPGIAAQFERWIEASGNVEPWLTCVSFVNPHDIAWWYSFTRRVPSESDPPPVSRALAPNFETPEQLIAHNKPSLQRSLQETAAESFGPVPFTGTEAREVWLPFMDLYVHLQREVDRQVGRVLGALAARSEIAENTIVIFSSDHGEYASSHGLRGKGASAYEEALRVPLVVKDPRGRLTSHTKVERTGLTSSVDIAPLLLTIATGSSAWRSAPRYAHLAHRHDIAPMLRDPHAPGRPFVMHATDEIVSEFAVQRYAYEAPRHVVALRTQHAKAASYSHWAPGSFDIVRTAQEHETYDYGTHRGRLEIENVTGVGSLDEHMQALLARSIREELRRPLPPDLHNAQQRGWYDYVDVAQDDALSATAARAQIRRRMQIPAPKRRNT